MDGSVELLVVLTGGTQGSLVDGTSAVAYTSATHPVVHPCQLR